MSVRSDSVHIIDDAIHAVLPDTAVEQTLKGRSFGSGKVVLAAIGKAAWQMANAAYGVMGNRISEGVVVTKYGHVKGPIADFTMVESGHPVPDENSFKGTQSVIDMVSGLAEEDTVLFLISGGGSALFEKPLIPAADLERLTNELLASGADIKEMNTIRKRMSAVKGGRFAELCMPARVFCIVLSDIIGDPLDMIASGPAAPDTSTCADARAIAEKYGLTITPDMDKLLSKETPKELTNVETHISGSVRQLCKAAADSAAIRGYKTVILTDCLCCEAAQAGSFLASVAKSNQDAEESIAFIAGGETVVHLNNTDHPGKGGRSQELAIAAALQIEGLKDTVIFSVGSDGTDGPTDAAGGLVDGRSIGPGKMDRKKADAMHRNLHPGLQQMYKRCRWRCLLL